MSRVFILSEPTGPRLSVSLAAEIGLKESIVLLQIEYWISTGGHIRDGFKWTYQSLESLKAQFPFMSKTTINRVIDRLESMRILHVTDSYNKRAGDKTRWFAINEEGCNKLESIRLIKVKTLYQNGETLYQNETTLPNDFPNNGEYIAEAGAEEDTEEDARWDIESDLELFDDWVDSGVEELEAQPQQFLASLFAPRDKKPSNAEPIPKVAHNIMYRICYRAETAEEQLTLSTTQRGKVASVLGQLHSARADLMRLSHFEAWWLENWRSKDRATGQYQAPRPDQVLEHWNEAMKSGVKPKSASVEHPKHDVSNLSQVMREHRTK